MYLSPSNPKVKKHTRNLEVIKYSSGGEDSFELIDLQIFASETVLLYSSFNWWREKNHNAALP